MKITKKQLKQLIKEELVSGAGMDPTTLLKMLCASETIGAVMLQKMAEEVLKNPSNVLVALGPWREQIEQVTRMDLQTVVDLAMTFSVELPFLGSTSLRKALDMAASNPLIKEFLRGMIPMALKTVCQGAGALGESKQPKRKITKKQLKQLIKEELASVLSEDTEASWEAAREGDPAKGAAEKDPDPRTDF